MQISPKSAHMPTSKRFSAVMAAKAAWAVFRSFTSLRESPAISASKRATAWMAQQYLRRGAVQDSNLWGANEKWRMTRSTPPPIFPQ